MKKPLPIGIDDYKKIIEENFAYVDKTLFIQEIIERGTELALITRRFGKTLNLSTLKYFFEKTEQDHSHLFSPYKIWQTIHQKAQGKYPVIFLTLKEVKHDTWERTFSKLSFLIAEEFKRHRYLLDGEILFKDEKKIFQDIIDCTASQTVIDLSLKYLTQWLHRHHKTRVIILLDEYDAPVHMAYMHGYYEQIINFMRTWLGGALKGNPCLERGVITGILRIAKENIFSDLNHSTNFTLFTEDFGDKFGLLEEEVKALLLDYNQEKDQKKVRSWYNGYLIGSHSVYNPWSILNYIQHKELKPYWINTSGNELLKEQLIQKSLFFKEDFESLLLGNSITKLIDDTLVFTSLKNSKEAIWGLFLFSGYLTPTKKPNLSRTKFFCALAIPNKEILTLFQDMIQEYLTDAFFISLPDLVQDLITGNVAAFSQKFEQLVLNIFSSHDIPKEEPERVYHAFVLGILASLQEHGYEVRSNRESGLGRYDVCLFPKDPSKLGILLEFKKAKHGEKNLKQLAVSALEQIENLHYITELKNHGITKILALGMAFQGKRVAIQDKVLH